MYDSMKNKILQILSAATSGAEATPDIKVEPNNTFYSLNNSRDNSFDGRNSSNKHQNKDHLDSYGRRGNQKYDRGYQSRRQFRNNASSNWNSTNN